MKLTWPSPHFRQRRRMVMVAYTKAALPDHRFSLEFRLESSSYTRWRDTDWWLRWSSAHNNFMINPHNDQLTQIISQLSHRRRCSRFGEGGDGGRRSSWSWMSCCKSDTTPSWHFESTAELTECSLEGHYSSTDRRDQVTATRVIAVASSSPYKSQDHKRFRHDPKSQSRGYVHFFSH